MAELDPWHLFQYCPRCGNGRTSDAEARAPFRCHVCGLTYFFNAAAAVAAFVVRDDGRALFIRRAKEPARGKLGLAGGFVDMGEPVEEALRREVREEVNLELAELRFLSSHPNAYHYRDVVYPTVDLFFVAAPIDPERATPLDGVTSILWLDPRSLDPQELAFPSMQAALERYRGVGGGAAR